MRTRPSRWTTGPGSRTTSSRRCSKRGAAIIEARGASSAASAANAAIDHVRDWTLGTPDGDWVSMAIPSDGSYGVEEGIISSFPVTTSAGAYEVVQGLEVDDFSQPRIDATVGRAQGRARRGALTMDELRLLLRYSLTVNAQKLADESGRVPALAAALHLAVRCQARHHAVQVIRLDAHRVGQLGDR